MSLLGAIQKSRTIIGSMKPDRNKGTIIERVNQYLKAKAARNEPDDMKMHPSQIAYMCPREEVFKYLLPRERTTPKFTWETHLRFMIGTAVHKVWQNELLGPMGVLEGTWECRCGYKQEGLYPETTHREADPICPFDDSEWRYIEPHGTNDDLQIDGKTDGVLVYDEKRRLTDLKTIDNSQFSMLKYPNRKHVTQLMTYMKLFGIEESELIYIDKNSGKGKPFILRFNQAHNFETESKIRQILNCRENKVLPVERVCEVNDCSRAKKCPWVNECFDVNFDLKKAVEDVQSN